MPKEVKTKAFTFSFRVMLTKTLIAKLSPIFEKNVGITSFEGYHPKAKHCEVGWLVPFLIVFYRQTYDRYHFNIGWTEGQRVGEVKREGGAFEPGPSAQ